jgi:hypothetical protein
VPTTVAEGGCICGAIRYRVAGEPTNTMICHCQSCRRVAAAPVVAWVTFPKARFELLRGHPAEFRSSPPVRRTFCAACGTPLTYEHSDSKGSVVAQGRHRVATFRRRVADVSRMATQTRRLSTR